MPDTTTAQLPPEDDLDEWFDLLAQSDDYGDEAADMQDYMTTHIYGRED